MIGNNGKNNVVWCLSDNATGMTVFEATEQEANEFYAKYDKIFSDILKYTMYTWDAMPILHFCLIMLCKGICKNNYNIFNVISIWSCCS